MRVKLFLEGVFGKLRTKIAAWQGLSGAKIRQARENLSPKRWTRAQIRRGTLAFFAVFLPIYAFVGLQPALPAEASTYPTLTIADLGLTTPVEPLALDNHELIAPAQIAGSFSLHASTKLIIGHSSTVFSDLINLEIGDVLTYAEQTYQVTQRQILAKDAINMTQLLAARPTATLILMTCAGASLGDQDYTHRLILTAELVPTT